MKAKQSVEEKILSPTARTLIKQAKQEERERIVKLITNDEVLSAQGSGAFETGMDYATEMILKLINQEDNA